MPEPKTSQRVYEKLYTDIACGKYQYEEPLPSIIHLSEQFSVGRNTMRSVLKRLEEDQFIKQEKGKNACVIFDNTSPKYFQIFQETIYGRLPAMIEIFQVMEYIMPEIVEESLRVATAEDIEQIKLRIQTLKNKSMMSSYELMDALMSIYLYAFSLMHNDHVVDLFTEMMEFVTVIAPKSSIHVSEMTRSIRFLGQMMSTIVDYTVKRDAGMMKKAVKLMAHSSSKQIQRYVHTTIDEHIAFHPFPFHWNCNQDYLYQRIVIDILNDINLGKYDAHKDLPAFEQLAEQYHVSVRTSRKAIDVLNSYHVVKTINGVGSFVCVEVGDAKVICQNKEILSHIRDYCEMLQLLALCIKGIGYPFLRSMSEDEINDILEAMKETPSLKPLIQFLFIQNSTLMSIYQEIVKDCSWNVYVQSLYPFQKEAYDFSKAFQTMQQNLKRRRFKQVMKQVNEMMAYIYAHTYDVYQQMSAQAES